MPRMGKLQGRGIVCKKRRALYNYSREKYSREYRVLYVTVRGKHCGLPGLPDRYMQISQKEDFHTRGTECACMHTIIIVQEVEVHGCLLSGSEELLLFF